MRQPPASPLLPYTTLFRSRVVRRQLGRLLVAMQRLTALAAAEQHRREPLGQRRGVCSTPRLRREALHRYEQAADRKSTRLNSSHQIISYAVFCLKKKKEKK